MDESLNFKIKMLSLESRLEMLKLDDNKSPASFSTLHREFERLLSKVESNEYKNKTSR